MAKIVTKTPLRISFVGGGTDLPDFYQKYGGCVISTAIDKYIMVTVSPRTDPKICVSTPEGMQTVNCIDQIRHPLVREALRKTGVSVPSVPMESGRLGGTGITIEIASDVAAGSGLGGSSAVTVGLLHALRAYYTEQQVEDSRNGDAVVDIHPKYTTNPIYTWTLARQACEIEINSLGNPIGKQDQYIAAYGGFRRFDFHRNGDVGIESIEPPADLERVLMLFDTGIQREAKTILSEQQRDAAPATLLKMKRQVKDFADTLMTGDSRNVGILLHEAWKLKRSLTPCISTDRLDTIYRLALDAGAVGGKVLGAGGGGHFLFVVPLPCQASVIKSLDGLARHVPFRFEPKGTRLICPINQDQEAK